MTLTIDQKYEYRDRILRGYVNFHDGKFVGRIIDLPTIKELSVDSFYKNKYEEGIRGGLLSDSEAIKLAVKNGQWQEDWDIGTLDKQIEMLKKDLQTKKFYVEATASIRKKIEEIQKERDELSAKHGAIMSKGTARYYANKSTAFHKVDMTIKIKYGTIDGEADYFLLYNILDTHSLSVKDIREIARSNAWMVLQNAAKNKMGKLFEDLKKLTFYQEQLVSWSNTYSYAYQHPDSPDQLVIDDDDLFDKWLEDIDKKERSKKIKAKGDYKELFIPSDRYGAAEIYSMNEQESRAEVQKNMQKVQSGSFVG